MSTRTKSICACIVMGLVAAILIPTGIFILDYGIPRISIEDLDVRADKSAVVCAICAVVGLGVMLKVMFTLSKMEKRGRV